MCERERTSYCMQIELKRNIENFKTEYYAKNRTAPHDEPAAAAVAAATTAPHRIFMRAQRV